MKISEMLKVQDDGWVRKPKGFRVLFQRYNGAELEEDTMPGPKGAPLDSDVVAWRSAWKMAQAAKPGPDGLKEGDLVNLRVIDDEGTPIKYYATNRFDVFNVIQGIPEAPYSDATPEARPDGGLLPEDAEDRDEFYSQAQPGSDMDDK